MAFTAWKSPGTITSEDRDSKVAWTDPTNAGASDDSFAWCQPGKNTYGDWLRAVNYGFTTGDIPSGSTIDGIELRIEKRAGASNISDDALYLRKTSGQVGSNYASGAVWPTSDAYVVYGGATDKWGTTWVDTDIVGVSAFGSDFSLAGTTGGWDGKIDHVEVRIYYTTPGAAAANDEYYKTLLAMGDI